jgi:hypothetical protein
LRDFQLKALNTVARLDALLTAAPAQKPSRFKVDDIVQRSAKGINETTCQRQPLDAELRTSATAVHTQEQCSLCKTMQRKFAQQSCSHWICSSCTKHLILKQCRNAHQNDIDATYCCRSCDVECNVTHIHRTLCDCIIESKQELQKRRKLWVQGDGEDWTGYKELWPNCVHSISFTQEEMFLVWGAQALTLDLDQAPQDVIMNPLLEYLYCSAQVNLRMLSGLPTTFALSHTKVKHLIISKLATASVKAHAQTVSTLLSRYTRLETFAWCNYCIT